jgi:hypothetical protein
MSYQANNTRPKWLTYQTAPRYCGLCARTLQNYEKAGLIRVANVIMPGSKRGRKLIDRESLDEFIEANIGKKTMVPICQKKGGRK